MIRLQHPLGLAAAHLLLSASLFAQTQVSIAPSKDNTLYEPEVPGALSNGAGTRVFIGQTARDVSRRTVLAFDVAAEVPPCSRIQSVELRMQMVMTIAGAHPATLHRLTKDWGEGPSVAGGLQGMGAPAAMGDATWDHTFFPNSTWTTAGGDFVAAASGSQMIHAEGPYAWTSTPQMVADLQAWLDDPSGNYGWLILGDETMIVTAKAFASREDTRPGFAPELLITYRPPSASVTSVGRGCTGNGNSPLTATASGNPTVPNRGFALTLTGGPRQTLRSFVFALELAARPIPVGQCLVYLDPRTTLLALPVNPIGSLPLPIANAPRFLGVTLEAQGVAAHALLGQLATSNALSLKFGL